LCHCALHAALALPKPLGKGDVGRRRGEKKLVPSATKTLRLNALLIMRFSCLLSTLNFKFWNSTSLNEER
jgi:hypothetical protein